MDWEVFEEFTQEPKETKKPLKEEDLLVGELVEAYPVEIEQPAEQDNPFAHLVKSSDRQANYVSPAIKYIASLRSKQSQHTMAYVLKSVASTLSYDDIEKCPWGNLNVDAVNYVIRQLLDKKLSPKTINTYLTAIKQVCKIAWYDKLMDVETYQRINEIKSIKGKVISKRRSLETDEIRALLQVCSAKRGIDLRDAAIFALTRSCGLRRAEVASLQASNVNITTGHLVVTGKGNKQRELKIPKPIRPILKNWIDYRESFDWKERTKPSNFFTPMHKSGRPLTKEMHPKTIYEMLKRRQKEANIASCSPHDLRHSFCTGMLENGVDINDVQVMMGHSSITTTQIYDRRNNDRILDIMEGSDVL